MSGRIVELFGYAPEDKSAKANKARVERFCPFIEAKCTKRIARTEPSGACTVQQTKGEPIICCPHRLYGNEDQLLGYLTKLAFGKKLQLVSGNSLGSATPGKEFVVIFGKGRGGELRLPKKKGRGNYFVDWILAHIDKRGALQEFVAVEVQTIDTTGNYQEQRKDMLAGKHNFASSSVGLNWENVNKRIIPQLVYKGNVLRREPLCKKGLFFVCPTPIYNNMLQRLGGNLESYHPGNGTITFQTYGLEKDTRPGEMRKIFEDKTFTTTVEQVSNAFDRAQDLPPPGVYQAAIVKALSR